MATPVSTTSAKAVIAPTTSTGTVTATDAKTTAVGTKRVIKTKVSAATVVHQEEDPFLPLQGFITTAVTIGVGIVARANGAPWSSAVIVSSAAAGLIGTVFNAFNDTPAQVRQRVTTERETAEIMRQAAQVHLQTEETALAQARAALAQQAAGAGRRFSVAAAPGTAPSGAAHRHRRSQTPPPPSR